MTQRQFQDRLPHFTCVSFQHKLGGVWHCSGLWSLAVHHHVHVSFLSLAFRTPAVQPYTVQLVGLDSAPCPFYQHLQPRCTRTYLHEPSKLLKSTCIKAFVGAILSTSSPDAIGAVDICAIFFECTGIEFLHATTQQAHLAEVRRLRGAHTRFCVRRRIPMDVKRLERTRVAPVSRPEMLITQIAMC